MNIETIIRKIRKADLEEKKSSKKERFQVNVNPNSVIGREMKYQTALLHEILNEVREQKITIKKEGKNPPFHN